jgi:hypothetical protein
MIEARIKPVDPVEREVEITLTLTFTESKLRELISAFRLARFLSEEFAFAIRQAPVENDPYNLVLEALSA